MSGVNDTIKYSSIMFTNVDVTDLLSDELVDLLFEINHTMSFLFLWKCFSSFCLLVDPLQFLFKPKPLPLIIFNFHL